MKTIKHTLTSILLVCLVTFSAFKVNAQTTLAPGDIAIIAWDANASSSSTNHQLQWVPLVPLDNGTIIKFTEAGFNTSSATSSAGTWRTGHIAVWQNNTGFTIGAGTIISNTYINSAGASTTSLGSISIISAGCVCGSLSSGPPNMAITGGHHFIYQGGSASGSTTTDFANNGLTAAFFGSALYMFYYQGTTGNAGGFLTSGAASNPNTQLPTDLANYSLALTNNAENGYYNGQRTGLTKSQYMTEIRKSSNWTFATTTESYPPANWPTTNFSFGTPNTAPTFSNATTTLSVCQNAAATSINSLLQITDADASQTETFTVTGNPNHGGSITIGTTVASGTNVSPTGWSYTPANNYSGTETFTVQVSDGTATASKTITVTVNPLANAGTISGSSSVCSNGATTLTSNGDAGGTWSSDNTAAATVNSSGGVNGVAAGSATISYAVTNGCGTVTATKAITVIQETKITIQPPSVGAVCSGSGITEPLTALGVNLSYQWQASTDNGGSYHNISDGGIYAGTQTSTLTISNVSASDNGTKHRCLVTGDCGSVTSFAKTLLVKANHTITASAGTGGTISNAGTTTVCDGNDAPTYTITPNSGYNIADVLVDGNSVGAVSTRNFFGVTADHTISATFVLSCVATSHTTTASVCNSYTWAAPLGNGTTYTTSGIYTNTSTNAGGCTHTETLNLTINSSSFHTTTASSCDSYTWSAPLGNGTTYTASGTYTNTSTNAAGCTHTETLNLTINTSTSHTTTASSCDSYTWAAPLGNGTTYTASGTYTNTSTNAGGCTHTETLNLTINTSTTHTTTASSCNSYTWAAPLGNGTTYTTSGTYTNTSTNAAGCTHTETLDLTINQPTSSTNTASVCSNQLPYSWNGLSFTAAGTQTKTGLTNSKGCDSSATLTLSVATSSTPTVSVSASANNICSGILVTFTASVTNEGTAPVYQWKKNGVNVGTNSNTYASPSLVDKDSIWCVLTSNSACATTATVSSNKVKMIIKTSPLVSPVKSNVGVNITTQTMCTIGGAVTLYNTYLGGTWSSSNPSVATAVNGVATSGASSSGLLTAVGNGTTTVTYTIGNSNGCSASASATIFVDAVPTLNATTGGASGVCIGSNIALSNTSTIPAGGNGVWLSTAGRATVNATTGVVSGVNAGTASIKYTITNTSGCSNSTTASVVVNSLPTAPSINYAVGTVNPQTGATGGGFCNNRTFTVLGNPTGGVWSTTNASVVTVTSAGLVKTIALGSGSIVYTYTNTNGCSSTRSIVGNVVACVPRGVNGVTNEKQETRNEFTMYPNPAKSFISLNVNTLIGAGSIVVTDLYGKQVKTQSLSIGTNTIDVSSFTKGIYFVSTITNEGKTTKKLVVE